MQRLEAKLERIGRQYVHRHSEQVDFDELLQGLLEVARGTPRDAAFGELLLRCLGDACDFCSGWGLLSGDEALDTRSSWLGLEQVALDFPFGVTQGVRLRSIAVRTRAAWAAACPETAWKDIYERLVKQTEVRSGESEQGADSDDEIGLIDGEQLSN